MSITIVHATASLIVDGTAAPGCPMLVGADCVEIIPTKWLTTLWDGSPDTAWSYAQHLKRWWTYLGERGLPWWEIIPDDVRRYRTELQVSGLGNRSIKAMLSGVDSFYRWAEAEGLVLGRRFSLHDLRRTAKAVPIFEKRPRKHTKEDFDAIQAALPRATPGLTLRDEIIGECGRLVGLRRQEVAGLTVAIFEGAPVGDPRRIDLDPRTTKGRKSRGVFVPPSLLKKIARYLEVYRPQIIEAATKRNANYRDPGALLLTRVGAPVRREYVNAVWALKARAAGKPTRFHLNRHTMLSGVIRTTTRAGDRSLRLAQDLAGHASEQTTQLYNHNNGFEDGDPFELALIKDAHKLLGG